MKKFTFLTLTLFSFSIYAQVDHHCGQEKYQENLYNNHPELRPENNKAFKDLESFIKDFKPESVESQKNINSNLQIGYDYIIPVVVHVVHKGGIENLSDATIKRSIDLLNQFFSGVTENDRFNDPLFASIRGAYNGKKLHFELAKFDPNGNPTSGITRDLDVTNSNNGYGNALKSTYGWPRENYYNIYIVSRLSDTSTSSGFATFPSDVASTTNAYLDGQVMCFWAYGEHTNMWQNWYYNIAHETGHWLNLAHIWAYNGNNGAATNCFGSDDFVTDTPKTRGNSLSDMDNFPGFSHISCTGIVDNYNNVMDYTSSIYGMFTVGQKNRTEATLNSTVSSRNNLWSAANVLAKLYGCTTGVDSDGDGIPNTCDTCPNDIYNDSDGDGICDSADQCPGKPDVNLDANPASSDACDALLPIIDFNTNPILRYSADIEDKGVHSIDDGGATLHTSVNAWKAIDVNYNVTANTILEFDFMSTIDGERHAIGIDNDLVAGHTLSFKLFGNKAIPDSAANINTYNTYTDADKYTYKHYNIPIGTYFTGLAKYLFFSSENDTFTNPAWTASIYPGGGSFNDATSFFRNVKIYEPTVLSYPSFTSENLLKIISKNSEIKIISSSTISNVVIFDLLGRTLINKSNCHSKEVLFNNIKSNQVLLVKVILEDRSTTTRKIITE
ncbi:T9SS sorting signal type C domain-containing protein [Flavobacterium amnicola]|uniref:T9SS sorting signal type C domain-containing protein n=1 Tax=Flavobacterium amnicola TaxID=2506422 RepID=A0A4Q1K3I2_9FLAO|nr:M43 family zinc metalloprotease [Flavobacterium amnicola]RXR20353.1 T9SS sorting signal type C domain-containing protein [Flavobacterium amnicola]